jgi:hypothetical protein
LGNNFVKKNNPVWPSPSAVMGVLVLLCLVVAGCQPVKPSQAQAMADVRAMTFVAHRGVCFGVVRFETYHGYAGTSVTVVPGELCR